MPYFGQQSLFCISHAMELSMRYRFFLFIALCAVLPVVPAVAQRAPHIQSDVAKEQSIYEAEVPVNSQGDSDRKAGIARALSIVLGKVTGDRSRNAKLRPEVSQALRDAAVFVDSYDYRQDQGSSPGGAPTSRTMLTVHFRPDEVNALVGALALPLWPQPRPKPVLWLAIDDGSGPRLVGVQQSRAVRSVLDRAIERGYRLGLPAGRSEEQALVTAIWRRDVSAVLSASTRYTSSMQLVGKLYRSGNGWAADWIFVDGGEQVASWSSSNADALRVMADGADGAADALVKRYAKVPLTGTPGVYRVGINGIRSADDYLRVSAALQRVPVVRSMIPVKASAERLEVYLDLMTGITGLNRMLGGDSALQPVAAATLESPQSEGELVEYVLK
ncbi:DUF2066 domain-containing protein [Xylella fastidiosa subsp. fastidiosa]|jgi:hypothetical protein|nr:DUF2066 domain-containing protein [Xylella fastidiosa]MBE0262202.1 DUF2066 domain-containing protein [Xylella fastidiosa subsp. fastidiosa]MBE0264334.1 DUF2066 domain-containing protein [Xylella fastidiosa subsp. fastidiosa]MBE0266488.1 DUF2066 domain-containing protein [Xylella fastidiosa subsp. fastidiosa]MBE0271033.1 DUF2066 domain-containing protein [Xylella fastidiosa subsp. fastidiosa]MBE0273345.1 DUF2066 domain-containing protein [Xylella fastidiosa subsp. fastidiosa]